LKRITDIYESTKNHKSEWIENGKETADDFDKATADKVSKKPYAIGGDTAGDGSDFNTAKVIDNITMRTVASMQMKYIADDLYADQVYCLGKYYHDAIIGIETNFSIVPTLELVKAQYQNLYKQEKLDTTTGKMKDSYGFLTTQQTRHTILQGLLIAHRNDPETECDPSNATRNAIVCTEQGWKSRSNSRQARRYGYVYSNSALCRKTGRNYLERATKKRKLVE